MPENPFDVIKAEEFNHGLHQLASLMHFNVGLAGTLLSSSNVFLDGSRGPVNPCIYVLLSVQAKTIYEELATQGTVEPLPDHKPFLGVYMKLAPTLFGPHEYEHEPGFADVFRSSSTSERWNAWSKLSQSSLQRTRTRSRENFHSSPCATARTLETSGSRFKTNDVPFDNDSTSDHTGPASVRNRTCYGNLQTSFRKRPDFKGNAYTCSSMSTTTCPNASSAYLTPT